MGVYGEKGLRCPRVEYSYTYQSPPGGRDGHQEESLEIKLRCPRVSSFRWCLKLYSLVLAALGLLLSFIWICFQLYVLSQTTIYELRLQRYLDIFLGLLLLLSLVCLLYGSYCESRIWIIAFITGSLAVVLTYWCWYLYIKYSGMEYPESEQTAGEVGGVLSVLYILVLLPVLLLYRSLELAHTQQPNIGSPRSSSYIKRKPPPKYDEGMERARRL